jgi:hypothetical protein
METIRLNTHVGHDGILKLELPLGVKDVDCEVTITLQPPLSKEEWLRFIDETAGSLADDPIERLPQGEPDRRDEIR